MNFILNEVKNIMRENKELYLPHVTSADLEDDGAVFFMNSRDGTEFEWYINDKLPPFMMFYDDEDKMGAVKLLLYRDGTADIFIFDNNGKNMSKKVQAHIRCKEKQLLELAVILRAEADDCSKWDANIESIDTDINVSAEMMNNFLNQKSRYNEIKNMRTILNQRALVSKKIIERAGKSDLCTDVSQTIRQTAVGPF